MSKPTRRLTDIKFEHEGAHVALVGPSVGGAANGYTTLVTKATDHVDAEEAKKALETLSLEHPLEIIEEPIVDTIEKSVHEALVLKAVTDAIVVEKQESASAIAVVQKALDDQAVILKAAQDKLAEYEAATVTAKETSRKEALAAVVAEDQVETLFKSLAPLDDASFEVVLKGYSAQKAAVDASGMMEETGLSGGGEADPVEVDNVAAILKAKYQNKSETK